jgi:hypothetical protein
MAPSRGGTPLVGQTLGHYRALEEPADAAFLHVAAGDHAEALDWLERAFDVHDPQMTGLGRPFLDSLRSEPRD